MAKLLGILGALASVVGIVSGVASLWPFIHTNAAVRVWVEKAALYGLPSIGGSHSLQPAPQDFGSVTVAITNRTDATIEKPRLKFQYLRDCKGLVVVEGTFSRAQFPSLEQGWNDSVSHDNAENTVIDLPPLGPGDGITVQAFGTDWKYVNPQLFGTNNTAMTWIVTVPDSRMHQYLFGYHLWTVGLGLIIFLGAVLAFVSFKRHQKAMGQGA